MARKAWRQQQPQKKKAALAKMALAKWRKAASWRQHGIIGGIKKPMRGGNVAAALLGGGVAVAWRGERRRVSKMHRKAAPRQLARGMAHQAAWQAYRKTIKKHQQ
jgi:hypothetical protein